MKKINFPALNERQIKVRISRINESGAELTLYKDARVDQEMLDEYVGAMWWQRKHKEIVLPDGTVRISCIVSIYDTETNQWVSKEDYGSNDYTFELEKASASDSFKRACTNWGIGRELYSCPEMVISSDMFNQSVSPTGRPVCYDKFSVIQLRYDETQKFITAIAIRNETTGKMVFYYDQRTNDQKDSDKIRDAEIKQFKKEQDEKRKKRMEELNITPSSHDASSNTARKASSKTTQKASSKTTQKASSNTAQNASVVADCGGTRIRGKALHTLTAAELLYVVHNTTSAEVKKAAFEIAKTNPQVNYAFTSAGVL